MTELIWEGKYDDAGRKIAPLRVALPFQTVETVNESAQDRQLSLERYTTGRNDEWRNRLIWGDKKYVLPALLQEFAGKVDLVYLDPPFATGQDFSLPVQVGGEHFTKEPSIIEVKAYRDTWGSGLDSYLEWFYGTAVFIQELLAETGSLYVHLEPGVSHLVKIVLDEIFGRENFRNEITWKRTGAHSGAKRYGPAHDSILFYSRSSDYTWNTPYREYDVSHLKKFKHVDGEGKQFSDESLTGPGRRSADSASAQPWGGYDPTAAGRHWQPASYAYDKYVELTGHDLAQYPLLERLDRLDKVGMIFWPAGGARIPRLKRFLDDQQGAPAQDVWVDIDVINSRAEERVGYPTQKPEDLLRRIVEASSNENDLVLDCVVGSGTTAVAAEKLNRRWVVCDLSRFAIHTVRKRLLNLGQVRPFAVQNLGKYERQVWQGAEFGELAEAKQAAYRRLILDLYHATEVIGYGWLHGVKSGRMVHVGAVDSPVSLGDITQIAGEFRRAIGTGTDAPRTNGVDVLGWDFAFELNEVAKQKAAQANIDIRFLRIPHDVMDKRARDQGDILFFELAALAVDAKASGRKLTLTLTDFVIPPDEVPEDVQRAITQWEQWIDYWAVDWDNRGDTFHNQWQEYRTRMKRDLQKTITHTYEQPGEYAVVIKVIDILGNDTTKTLKVAIK